MYTKAGMFKQKMVSHPPAQRAGISFAFCWYPFCASRRNVCIARSTSERTYSSDYSTRLATSQIIRK